MTALWVLLAVVVGFVLGRMSVPREAGTDVVTITEDEPVKLKDWTPRMSPLQYLKQFPDGPYAEQARAIAQEHGIVGATRRAPVDS